MSSVFLVPLSCETSQKHFTGLLCACAELFGWPVALPRKCGAMSSVVDVFFVIGVHTWHQSYHRHPPNVVVIKSRSGGDARVARSRSPKSRRGARRSVAAKSQDGGQCGCISKSSCEVGSLGCARTRVGRSTGKQGKCIEVFAASKVTRAKGWWCVARAQARRARPRRCTRLEQRCCGVGCLDGSAWPAGGRQKAYHQQYHLSLNGARARARGSSNAGEEEGGMRGR